MGTVKTIVGASAAAALLAGTAGLTAAPAGAVTAAPRAASAARIAGADREATAIAASRLGFPVNGSAKAVVLARADQYPDALAGAPLASSVGGPLLLTSSGGLDSAVQTEIQRVAPKGATVYLLGGTAALADAVASGVGGAGYSPHRLAGTDRFATAVAIAQQIGSPSTIVEVTGTSFADALAAGPAAVASRGAVLLTNGLHQASATASYLSSHASIQRFAIGGPASAADSSAFPLYGPDRYSTAVVAAQRFFPHPLVIGAATGSGFADALGAGPVVAAAGGPVLLVPSTGTLPASVTGYITASKASLSRVYVFGGTAVVSDSVMNQLAQAAA